MIDHVTLCVKDLEKSRVFYEKVFAVLGYILNIGSKEEGYYGFGVGDDPLFEIAQSTQKESARTNVHVAFKAKDKTEVKDFYSVAMKNGA